LVFLGFQVIVGRKIFNNSLIFRGDLVWKRMEKDENVAPGRTWQSLKER